MMTIVKKNTHYAHLLLVFTFAIRASGQPILLQGVEPEEIVNENQIDAVSQHHATVAINGEGTSFTVWMDDLDTAVAGGEHCLKGRFRFLHNGGVDSVWEEFVVQKGSDFDDSTSLPYQCNPDVDSDGDERFVVAFCTRQGTLGANVYRLYAKVYTIAGKNAVFIDTIRVDDRTSGWPRHRSFPDVCMNSEGEFIVSWTELNPADSSYDVFVRLFSPEGIPRSLPQKVNTVSGYVPGDGTGNYGLPDIDLVDSVGMVVWERFLDETTAVAEGRKFTLRTGQPLLLNRIVTFRACGPDTLQRRPMASMNADTNILVCWNEAPAAGDSSCSYELWTRVWFNNGNSSIYPIDTSSALRTHRVVGRMSRERGLVFAYSCDSGGIGCVRMSILGPAGYRLLGPRKIDGSSPGRINFRPAFDWVDRNDTTLMEVVWESDSLYYSPPLPGNQRRSDGHALLGRIIK